MRQGSCCSCCLDLIRCIHNLFSFSFFFFHNFSTKICLAIGPQDLRDDFRTSFQQEAGGQQGRFPGPVGPVGPVDPVPVAQSSCTDRLVQIHYERVWLHGPVGTTPRLQWETNWSQGLVLGSSSSSISPVPVGDFPCRVRCKRGRGWSGSSKIWSSSGLRWRRNMYVVWLIEN